MSGRPIIFSAPMVRAVLSGAKTQTRRPVRGRALDWLSPGMFLPTFVANPENGMCPYGKPGERLWVREAFRQGDGSMSVHYRADEDEVSGGPWRPSIFMPRWASRISLEVVEVRIQRLQEICIEDFEAEGVYTEDDIHDGFDWQAHWVGRWDSIYGDRAPWDSNPWVWVVSFRRCQ